MFGHLVIFWEMASVNNFSATSCIYGVSDLICYKVTKITNIIWTTEALLCILVIVRLIFLQLIHSSVVFHQKKSVFLQVEWWWKKWAMNTPAGPIHFSSYRYAKYADNSKWYHVGIAKVPKIHFAWQRRPHGSVVLNNIRYPKSSCIQKA